MLAVKCHSLNRSALQNVGVITTDADRARPALWLPGPTFAIEPGDAGCHWLLASQCRCIRQLMAGELREGRQSMRQAEQDQTERRASQRRPTLGPRQIMEPAGATTLGAAHMYNRWYLSWTTFAGTQSPAPSCGCTC